MKQCLKIKYYLQHDISGGRRRGDISKRGWGSSSMIQNN